MTKKINTKPAYRHYSCIAGEPELGGARCQGRAVSNNRCEEHQDEEQFPMAVRPHIVLVKMHLPKPKRLLSEGLLAEHSGWRYQSATKRNPLSVIEDAERAGRNPKEYDERYLASGSEVWCGDGATNVVVPPQLLAELYSPEAGNMGIHYMRVATKAHAEGILLLQIAFTKEAKEGKMPRRFAVHLNEITELMKSLTWLKVNVYCNLLKPDNVCLHAIEMTGPQENLAPRGIVRFRHGDWGIDEPPSES